MRDFDWTAERIGILQQRQSDGVSFAQIAAELGCSRSAAIGKSHRLNLPRPLVRAQPGPKPRRVNRLTALMFAGKQLPPARSVKKPAPIACNPITLMELRSEHCRWPVSGERAETLFCGCARADERPYCDEHCCMAYRRPGEPQENERDQAA